MLTEIAWKCLKWKKTVPLVETITVMETLRNGKQENGNKQKQTTENRHSALCLVDRIIPYLYNWCFCCADVNKLFLEFCHPTANQRSRAFHRLMCQCPSLDYFAFCHVYCTYASRFVILTISYHTSVHSLSFCSMCLSHITAVAWKTVLWLLVMLII